MEHFEDISAIFATKYNLWVLLNILHQNIPTHLNCLSNQSNNNNKNSVESGVVPPGTNKYYKHRVTKLEFQESGPSCSKRR